MWQYLHGLAELGFNMFLLPRAIATTYNVLAQLKRLPPGDWTTDPRRLSRSLIRQPEHLENDLRVRIVIRLVDKQMVQPRSHALRPLRRQGHRGNLSRGVKPLAVTGSLNRAEAVDEVVCALALVAGVVFAPPNVNWVGWDCLPPRIKERV